ncbi:MAG: metallophosphoesterase [Flavobacterium sp.]|nr:metallophosphoesterase [Flavobacterium sp.]
MIITVFGDVHGNLITLEKLFKLEKSETDLFISHGDIVNYGPWSNDCIAFLNNQNNCKLLKGNHEKYFIDGFYDGTNVVARSFFDFCFDKFDNGNKKIIENYTDSFETENFTIQHTLFDKYIFADTDISENKINKNFIIGHSHQQYERDLGNFKIYNTGSLGQNRSFINVCNYLKIDTETNVVTLKSFTHNIDAVINQMKSQHYPTICTDYYLSKNRI